MSVVFGVSVLSVMLGSGAWWQRHLWRKDEEACRAAAARLQFEVAAPAIRDLARYMEQWRLEFIVAAKVMSETMRSLAESLKMVYPS